MIIDKNSDKFKEECGVFGIFSERELDISTLAFHALSTLQHRGQESCGIALSDGNHLQSYKGMGLVSEVFNRKEFNNLQGKAAIGHVRYSTSGRSNLQNAQPLLAKLQEREIAIAHNGHLTNSLFYKNELLKKGVKFKTTSDSEVFLKMLEQEAGKTFEESIITVMKKLKGGYAVVILFNDRLIGIRDPEGIRPLCLGKLDNNYIFCSESCTLDSLGAELIRDVAPGEVVAITEEGWSSVSYGDNVRCATCAFEYIYFARQDSVIDGVNVYSSRVLAGQELFKEHPVKADIVIGVPDSGLAAAIGYSKASGIDYEMGFAKNNYIGRTFIQPSKKIRERDISLKLNVIKKNVQGKRVVVVDDSIVRGNTSKKIVALLKKAGAAQVHFRVASPVIKKPCYLGIDTKYKKELIGSSKSISEIRDYIGADSLGYLSIDSFLKTLQGKREACLKCFGF